MNLSEITWVSGWASDISIWEDEIYKCFPDFSHRFVDYYDLLPEPDDFWDDNPKIAETGLIIGWSMGTLALLRNVHKKPQEQKWILICPIANFCAEECWQPSAVRATKQGVLENSEQTLLSFSSLMGNTQKDEREKWVENALKYSPKQLATGLDYLMQKKADISPTATFSNIEIIFGEEDKIVPIAQKKLFNNTEMQIKICENLGHWLPDYIRTAPWSALVASDA
jgi:pimeloyl-ACP methyl ester carboxylesterase